MVGGIYPGQTYPAGIGIISGIIIQSQFGLEVEIPLPNTVDDTMAPFNTQSSLIHPTHSREAAINIARGRRVYININTADSSINFP